MVKCILHKFFLITFYTAMTNMHYTKNNVITSTFQFKTPPENSLSHRIVTLFIKYSIYVYFTFIAYFIHPIALVNQFNRYTHA